MDWGKASLLLNNHLTISLVFFVIVDVFAPGYPKGVCLSHRALASNLSGVLMILRPIVSACGST